MGGIGRLSLLLADGFAERGYVVDLVLGKMRGEYLSQVPLTVNVVNLKVKKLLLSVNLIGSYLKREKPAVLITANERVNIMAILAKIIYRSKTKLIISVHVNNSEIIARKGASLYKRVIIKVARPIYKWSDRVVAVSNGVADDVAQLFALPKNKITVVYNPIVTSQLKKRMNEELDHYWFTQNDYPVIVGMGRLTRQKDFSTLIKSFIEVKKVQTGAKLFIMGEGELRKELEREIKEFKLEQDVNMPGFIENPYKYLRHSSVFVLSSQWEGFGNVLVEAMATGTPVISTNCPSGPAEILENGKYGPLVPVGKPIALAEAIITVLRDPPDREFLMRRADDFSVDIAVDKYIQLIEDLSS